MGSSSGGSGQASSSGRSKPGSGNASVSSSSSRSGSSSSSGSKDSSKGSSSGSGSRSGSGRGSGGGGSRSGRGSGRGRGSQPLPSSKKSGGSSSGGGADCALRLFGIKVSAASDPGKDDISVHPALLAAVARRLGCQLSALQSSRQAVISSGGGNSGGIGSSNDGTAGSGSSRGSSNSGSSSAVGSGIGSSSDGGDGHSSGGAVSSSSSGSSRGGDGADSGSSGGSSDGGSSGGSSGDSAVGGGVVLVRKSFDARGAKAFEYVIDVPAQVLKAAGVRLDKLVEKEGWIERLTPEPAAGVNTGAATSPSSAAGPTSPSDAATERFRSNNPVVVVGSGPAGLFAALSLATSGVKVVLLERGQPVEQRGRDIGALFVRGQLNPDSNLCYGEGGAGTWSDGKLTTRIGRNSDPVRRVLQALVQFGAPESILVSGKPHLGTERLVQLLKRFRQHLLDLGVVVRFNTTVQDLTVTGGRCTGVQLKGGEEIKASAVILAVGHSARPLYQTLHARGVALTAKPFAMGFRVEHPQSLIDEIRYGADAAGVMRGKGKIPVADYTLATQVMDSLQAQASSDPSTCASGAGLEALASSAPGIAHVTGAEEEHGAAQRMGPPASSSSSSSTSASTSDSSSKAAGGDGAAQHGAGERGVYSFCMCPGGQIVPTSTNPEELCINGMSFSRRNSLWANSALVVTVAPSDWAHLTDEHGPLAGVALQVQYERLGAMLGGGGFVAPVQRVTDFLEGLPSSHGDLPSSSYRLGVRPALLHTLYSPPMTAALQQALLRFDSRLPGFVGPQALLHGVETRTSSPVRIERTDDSLESVSLPGLHPCGEGAGYAGGIVSAAVDGLRVGEAVARVLCS